VIFVVSFLGCLMAIVVTKAIGYTMLQYAMRKTLSAMPEPVLPPPLSPLEIIESARRRVDNGYVCSGCGHFEPDYDEKRWNQWIQAWRIVAKIHVWVDHFGIEIEGGYRGRRRVELLTTLRRWRAWADSGRVDFDRSGLGLDEALIDAFDAYDGYPP